MGLRDLIAMREASAGPGAVLPDDVVVALAPPQSDARLTVRPGTEQTAVEFAVRLRPDGKPLAFVMGPMIGLVAGDRAFPSAASSARKLPRLLPSPVALMRTRAPVVVMADGGGRSPVPGQHSASATPRSRVGRPRPDGRRDAAKAIGDAMRTLEFRAPGSAATDALDQSGVPQWHAPVQPPDPDADPLWWL